MLMTDGCSLALVGCVGVSVMPNEVCRGEGTSVHLAIVLHVRHNDMMSLCKDVG